MSETKFTPGPWRHTAYEGGWDAVEDKHRTLICTLVSSNPDNASLIVAAPDLFQLLTESIDIMERQVDYSGELASILTRAKAVLAKINS